MTTIILHAITFRYQRSTRAWIDYLQRVSLVFHINLCENKEIDTRKYSIFESVKSRHSVWRWKTVPFTFFLNLAASVFRNMICKCGTAAKAIVMWWLMARLCGEPRCFLAFKFWYFRSLLKLLFFSRFEIVGTLLLIRLHTIFFFVSVFFIKLMKTIAWFYQLFNVNKHIMNGHRRTINWMPYLNLNNYKNLAPFYKSNR